MKKIKNNKWRAHNMLFLSSAIVTYGPRRDDVTCMLCIRRKQSDEASLAYYYNNTQLLILEGAA